MCQPLVGHELTAFRMSQSHIHYRGIRHVSFPVNLPSKEKKPSEQFSRKCSPELAAGSGTFTTSSVQTTALMHTKISYQGITWYDSSANHKKRAIAAFANPELPANNDKPFNRSLKFNVAFVRSCTNLGRRKHEDNSSFWTRCSEIS